MKLLPLDTLQPKVYGGSAARAAGYVEMNVLLIDARVAQVMDALRTGDNDGAAATLGLMADELRMRGGLLLAWVQVMQMWMLAAAGDYKAVVTCGVDGLHTLVAVLDRSGVEYLSLVAAAIYLLALAHYSEGESKKAEKAV